MSKFKEIKMKKLNTDILIIGAGPAGLTAGYKLIDTREFIIIEKDPTYVGGISKQKNIKILNLILAVIDFLVNPKKLMNFGMKFFQMI